jgi:hypothetical protein
MIFHKEKQGSKEEILFRVSVVQLGTPVFLLDFNLLRE